MLVEIKNNDIIGVIVNAENGFKIVPIDELNKDINDQIVKLTELLNDIEIKVNQIHKADLVNKVESIENKFDNDNVKSALIRFVAFEILKDKINYDGIDTPSNYEEIRAWIFNPNDSIPKGFDEYLIAAKGGVE